MRAGKLNQQSSWYSLSVMKNNHSLAFDLIFFLGQKGEFTLLGGERGRDQKSGENTQSRVVHVLYMFGKIAIRRVDSRMSKS